MQKMRIEVNFPNISMDFAQPKVGETAPILIMRQNSMLFDKMPLLPTFP